MFEGAEVIYSYTRANAIEDGVLVDINSKYPEEVRDSGLRWPLAMTKTVWADFVKVHKAAERCAQDEKGRMWDILWMLCVAIKGGELVGSQGFFSFYAVGPRNRKPMFQRLKVVVGPGDKGEPVMTIMHPHED